MYKANYFSYKTVAVVALSIVALLGSAVSVTFASTHNHASTQKVKITSNLTKPTNKEVTISGRARNIEVINFTVAYPNGGGVSTDLEVVNKKWSITYPLGYSVPGNYAITIRANSQEGEVLAEDVLTIVDKKIKNR